MLKQVTYLLKGKMVLLAMALTLTAYATEATDSPTVVIVSPTVNQMFNSSSLAVFAANATDNDGTIVDVKFYVGKVLIDTDTSYPYRTGVNLAPGRYTLMIVATDNDGNIGASSKDFIVLGQGLDSSLNNKF